MNNSGSGMKLTKVPLGSVVLPFFTLPTCTPFSKVAVAYSPSRYDVTVKYDERAFTALVPTAFKPTENWKAS